VYTSSHSSSQVRWAAGDDSQLWAGKINFFRFHVLNLSQSFLNGSDGSAQSFENRVDITSLFQRDDSKVVTFIDPDHEFLRVGQEDTSSMWPVGVISRGSLHLILSSEQEMSIDEFLSLFITHCGVSVEFSFQIFIFDASEDLLHGRGDFKSGLFCSTWVQWNEGEVSGDSDSCGDDL